MSIEHIRHAEAQQDLEYSRQQVAVRKEVFLIGAKGRQGEAILNALLAEPSITNVQVLARQPMVTPTHKLTTKTLSDGIDAPVVAINLDAPFTEKAQAQANPLLDQLNPAKQPRSEHQYSLRRDDNYIPVETSNRQAILKALARTPVVKQLFLIAPLSAFQQYSRSAAYALDDFEFQCRALSTEHLSILRPIQEATPTSSGTHNSKPSFMQGFMQFWFSQFRWILPNPNAHLQSKDIATALIHAIKTAQPGVRIWSVSEISEQLAQAKAARNKGK